MIRQLIFISVFAAAAAMAALAQNVTGTVTCGGAGVSGVAVSDGINVVTTDKQGRYALQTDKANGYVFISIPRGYTVDMADGFNPQFWQKLSDAKVETAEVHNFKLTYSPADDYVMIIGADSHLARRIGDRKTYKNGYIASLKYEKEKAAESQLPTYSMILGDLTWDNFWYANKYTLRNFMEDQRKMHYPVPLFPVIGNHDNDPAVPHSANTDFLAAKLWRDVVCPNYYSYNLGKVHYVVLDNIVYQNDTLPAGKKARKGVWGQRNYNAAVTEQQINWLRQDLALVDKQMPVVVCSHIPTFRINRNFSTFGSLQNYKELASCFDGFKNVHFVSGHTHVNFNAHPSEYPHIMEHNIAAICASWWITGKLTGTDMCTDGSPAGYSRWIVRGDSIEWKYASIEDRSDPQMRVLDMNTVKQFLATNADAVALSKTFKQMPTYDAFEENSVLINVFAWDDDWKLEVTENGTALPTARLHAIDPAYLLAYALPRHKRGENVAPQHHHGTLHIFKAVASSPTTPVTVKVTDTFGHTYTTTLTRPAAFGR